MTSIFGLPQIFLLSQMSLAFALHAAVTISSRGALEVHDGVAIAHGRTHSATKVIKNSQADSSLGTAAGEDVWVRLPQVRYQEESAAQGMNHSHPVFVDEMMGLLADRPYMTVCCPKSEADVLRVGASIRPLNQIYDHSHPHYDAFWLVAYSLLDLVQPDGLLLEFGVAQGSSATLAGGILSQSSHPSRTYYGFDVFTGLPEAWGQFSKGAFANPNGELPPVPANVHLVKGLFNDTLPAFLAEHPGPAAFINIDCDLYTGAIEVLRDLRSRMIPGTILHFHEIDQVGVSQELKALNSFLQHEGRGMQLEMLNSVAWGEAAVFRVVATP